MLTLSEETTLKLLESLGLDPEAATDAEVSAALDEVMAVTPEDIDNVAQENEELKAELANRDLDHAGITDEQERETWKALILSNREEALKALDSMRNTRKTAPAALTNRVNLRTPAEKPVLTNRRQQQEALVNSVRLAHKCSFADAWNIAKSHNPQLFKEEQQ